MILNFRVGEMDILSGISAASTAVKIARDLREIDKGIDEAAYKLKLAELTEALADAKLALTDAKELVASLEGKLEEVNKGELCPKCKAGRLKLTDTHPKLQYGLQHYGVEEWSFECDGPECDFHQTRLHDPHGAIPKAAAGKLR